MTKEELYAELHNLCYAILKKKKKKGMWFYYTIPAQQTIPARQGSIEDIIFTADCSGFSTYEKQFGDFEWSKETKYYIKDYLPYEPSLWPAEIMDISNAIKNIKAEHYTLTD